MGTSASNSRRASVATDSEDETEARTVVLLGTGFSGKTSLFRAAVELCGGFGERPTADWPEHLSAAYPSTAAINERVDPAAIPDSLACGMSEPPVCPPSELARVLASPEYQRGLTLCPMAAAPASSARYLAGRLAGGALDAPPTSLDVSHLAQITTGAISRRLSFNGASLQLFDTGGQRNERKKWPQLLRGRSGSVTIVYVASLYHSGRTLYEDWDKDALEESLELLAALVRQYGESVPILLVLTGADALEESLRVRGSAESVDAIVSQTLDRFREVCPRVRHWLVNAVDEDSATRTMREVLAAVQSSPMPASPASPSQPLGLRSPPVASSAPSV